MGLKEKRKIRRERRKERRAKINKLEVLAKDIDLKKISSADDFLHNFNVIWPFLSEALELVKLLTRDKGDRAIDELIELGNRLAKEEASTEEQSKFFTIFGNVWRGVRLALTLVALFSVKEKVDDVIDDIIQVGDLINNYEPTEEEEAL